MVWFKKKDKEAEMCVIEGMWNVFTRVPWRAVDLRQGLRRRWWAKHEVALVELVWTALDEYYEVTYFQYAWLFKDGSGEVEDSSKRLFIERDSFIYNGVRCRRVAVLSQCGDYGCRALVLHPDDAIKRLWRLYGRYKAKRVSV
jgi:hypothetical protein